MAAALEGQEEQRKIMEVEENVIGAEFDSTGVNTGEEEGASIHLQRLRWNVLITSRC